MVANHFLATSSLDDRIPYRRLYVTHATRTLQSHDLSGEGIDSESHSTFLTTQEYEEFLPPMRDQLNAGATSDTTQT